MLMLEVRRNDQVLSRASISAAEIWREIERAACAHPLAGARVVVTDEQNRIVVSAGVRTIASCLKPLAA